MMDLALVKKNKQLLVIGFAWELYMMDEIQQKKQSQRFEKSLFLIVMHLLSYKHDNAVVLLNSCSKTKKAYFQQKSKIALGLFSGNHIPIITFPIDQCTDLFSVFISAFITSAHVKRFRMSTQLEIKSELFWLRDYWDQWHSFVWDYTQIQGAEKFHYVIHIFRSSPAYILKTVTKFSRV